MRLTVRGAGVQLATGGRSLDRGEPLVVLIHGAALDGSVWFQQTRFLAFHGYRAVAPDLPGHGHSDGPHLGSITAITDWLAELVDSLGSPAHLVGHSMGALIAIDAAARHQQMVRSIVLLGAGLSMPVHPELQAAAEADDDLADQLIAAWSHGHRQHIGDNPTPGLWMLGETVSLLHQAPDGVLATDLAACNSFHDAAVLLGDIACPITILAGTEDRMTPLRSARELADAAPHSTLKVVNGAGHLSMQGRPDVVRAALLDHLAAAEHA
jgi:pimeloyl-ACP methyl ester carboxylesterase